MAAYGAIIHEGDDAGATLLFRSDESSAPGGSPSHSRSTSKFRPWGKLAGVAGVVGVLALSAVALTSSGELQSATTPTEAGAKKSISFNDLAPDAKLEAAKLEADSPLTKREQLLQAERELIPESCGARVKRLLKEDAVLEQIASTEAAFTASAVAWSNKHGELVDSVAETTDDLTMEVSNEYGVMPSHTLSMYNYDHLLEPYKTSHLNVINPRDGASYHWMVRHISAEDETATELSSEKVAGAHATESLEIEVDSPNQWYHIMVVETTKSASTEQTTVLRTYSTTYAVSKFVRREIRSMTDSDREAVFGAMQTQYEKGFSSLYEATDHMASHEERLGDDRNDVNPNNTLADVTYLALIHNMRGIEYHGGTVFLTAHNAMQIMWEQSVRKAAEWNSAQNGGATPKVSSTWYWDETIDSALYGEDWQTKSVIYSDDWFGPADNDETTNYHLKSGRFKGAVVPRWAGSMHTQKDGKEHNLFDMDLGMYNQYGLLLDSCVPTRSRKIQRTNKFCGLTNTQTLPRMTNYVNCVGNYSTLADMETCMETNLHGNLHSLNGGAWGCTTNFEKLNAENPRMYPRKILNFLAVDSFNPWYKYSCQDYNWASSVTKDDSAWPCDLNNASCGEVTNLVDMYNISEAEVWEYGEEMLGFYSSAYQGDEIMTVVGEDSDFYNKTGSMMKWTHLPDTDEQTHFMRFVLNFLANPGFVGAAATGASPLDPLFWVWHGAYDKLVHVLRMASKYEDYDLDWDPSSSSYGANWTNILPVGNIFADAPTGKYFSNRALWGLENPENEHIEYVYDQFTNWGTEYWDPCDGDCQ